MTTNSTATSLSERPASGLSATRVYQLAAVALLIGLGLGYFLLGPRPATVAPRPAAKMTSTGMPPGGHPIPTMDQMKAMANVKAAPLLEKLKTDPKNAKLLAQIAAIYTSTHQFQEATGYYNKSLQLDPKNVTTRTELASALYYSGDADGAIRELQQALQYKPTDVNALFNLGMIKYQGKNDAPGAIATWQQLLKAHPDLDRKTVVQHLIEEAQQKAAAKK